MADHPLSDMPWHWGYEGLVTGDIVNELTALVGDPT